LLFIMYTVTLRAKFPPDLLLLVQNGDCRSRWGYFLLFRHGRAAMLLFPLTLRPSFFPKEPFLSLFLSSFHLFCFSFASSLHLFLFPFFLPSRVPRCDSHFGYLFLSSAPVVAWCNKACERSLLLLPLRENVEMFFFFFFFIARYTPGVSALFSLGGILCKTINWMQPLIRNVISWARRFVTGISCVYTGFFLINNARKGIY
jgi:hypothetical protein